MTDESLRREPSAEVGEGPYYRTGSPQNNSIAGNGTVGAKLILEGRVFDTRGRAIAGAWLDFWHADGRGRYDNAGFNLRGHQFTDNAGAYRLETVMPAMYGSRTPHIHVKVRAGPGSPVMTSQLFFPGEPRNLTDPLFNQSLVVSIDSGAKPQKAAFDFVLPEEGR